MAGFRTGLEAMDMQLELWQWIVVGACLLILVIALVARSKKKGSA